MRFTPRRERHSSAAQTFLHVIPYSTYADKWCISDKSAGAIYNNVLTNCATLLSPRGPSLALRAIHLVSRLRRPSDLCSSTLSDTAHRLRHGSTPCFPTVEKNLPFPNFEAVAGLWSAPDHETKGNGSPKRVETAGVYPFGFRGETAAVPPAAGAAIGYISPPTYNRSRGPLQYGSGPPANPRF